MTSYALRPLLGSEFDDFLYASLGQDDKGMPVSVVSALAQLDINPWQEAAALVRLPVALATKRLAALIGSLPEGSAAQIEPDPTAARLIALLPASGSVIATVTPRAGRALGPIAITLAALAMLAIGGVWMLSASSPAERPAANTTRTTPH